MRFLASSHRIDQLTRRTRILLALLVLGLLAQLVTGGAMQHLGGGWTPDSIARYYRGDAPDAVVADPLAAFGGLGGGDPTAAPAEIHVARSFGTLVEVAHFHLFAMPLAVFLAAHLFAMVPWGRTRWGAWLSYATFAAVALDIGAPFLVRYLAAGFAWLKLIGVLGLIGGQALMLVATAVMALYRLPPARPLDS